MTIFFFILIFLVEPGHAGLYAFLVGPYAFSGPITSTRTALKRELFLMVFQGKSAGRTGHIIIALTWVDASFSPFAHPNEINAGWPASIHLFWVKEIQDISALKWVLLRLGVYFWESSRVCLATQRNFTQDQLAATRDYLQVRLARA